MTDAARPRAPLAPKRPQVREVHGATLVDDYAWLRDPNWQRVMREPDALDPSIREYLEAENRWTDEIMKPSAQLRQTLFEELKGRIKEDDSSVPDPDGP